MRTLKNKRCSTCQTFKPLNDFGADRTKADGLDRRCRLCTSVRKQRQNGTLSKNEARAELAARGLKRCTHCGTEKSFDSFKMQKRKGGTYPTSWCRDCSNALSRDFMREHCKKPEVRKRMTEYAREYEKRPERLAKHRERNREYMRREDVRERFAEYLKTYNERPEVQKRAREWRAEWRDNNREKLAEASRRYLQAEHGKLQHRLTSSRRRARLRQVECTLTKEQWFAVLEAYGYRCAYCGAEDRLTIDHVEPISKGGAHTAKNVVPACKPCNDSKSDRSVDEWFASLGHEVKWTLPIRIAATG